MNIEFLKLKIRKYLKEIISYGLCLIILGFGLSKYIKSFKLSTIAIPVIICVFIAIFASTVKDKDILDIEEKYLNNEFKNTNLRCSSTTALEAIDLFEFKPLGTLEIGNSINFENDSFKCVFYDVFYNNALNETLKVKRFIKISYNELPECLEKDYKVVDNSVYITLDCKKTISPLNSFLEKGFNDEIKKTVELVNSIK